MAAARDAELVLRLFLAMALSLVVLAPKAITDWKNSADAPQMLVIPGRAQHEPGMTPVS
ncbi:hypothetical protein BRADO2895 [Bradyrhizobium sp. ORS 278]|nr:hypothetical protein BRADO2895 [Bradyrhizobium sp. ORS 278]